MAPEIVDTTDEELEEGVWTRNEEGELIPDYESTLPTINEGEVVHGTVVRVDKDEVLVDIGYKSEGVIPVAELSIRRSVNPADEVKVGDEIDALVMTKEDAECRLILSKKRAPFEIAWKHVKHPSEVLEIGADVRVKVLDIDRERQRISLGLKQTQSDPWQQVLESYHEGDVVEGRVTKVVTFGAFVEILPGVEGLVHISELAQHHVENPREVVSQGDAVNVLILEVDAERRRLSLSLKRVEDGSVPKPRADGGESIHTAPDLGLSEDVFAEEPPPAVEEESAPAAEEEPTPTAEEEEPAEAEAEPEPAPDDAAA